MKINCILLSALLLGMAGCTADEQQNSPLPNDKGEYAINFTGGINLTQTKATTSSNMTKGVKATIMAYNKDKTDASVASHEYVAGENGDLAASDYTMQLGKGTYDFYGVSVNSTSASAPAFDQSSNTTTSALSNGTDYLWVKKQAAIPGTNNNNVDLTFARKAVKIAITIKSGDGISIIGWNGTTNGSGTVETDAATITPSATTGCVMTLATGVITPATTLGSAVNMTTGGIEESGDNDNKKKTSVSYIMLPLAKNNGTTPTPTVTLKVKVKVGTQTDEELRTYTATLSAPSGTGSEFTSGNQYNYTATLNANGITFTGAKVTNWEEQTGGDLTPTEPEPAP